METILFDIATPVSVIRGCHIIKKRVKLSKEEAKVLDKHLLSNIKIVGNFGGTIAIPVVIFVLGGQWLDKRYHASPWFTIMAFVLAAIVSGKMIYSKSKMYGKEYQKMGEETSAQKNEGKTEIKK